MMAGLDIALTAPKAWLVGLAGAIDRALAVGGLVLQPAALQFRLVPSAPGAPQKPSLWVLFINSHGAHLREGTFDGFDALVQAEFGVDPLFAPSLKVLGQTEIFTNLRTQLLAASKDTETHEAKDWLQLRIKNEQNCQ